MHQHTKKYPVSKKYEEFPHLKNEPSMDLILKVRKDHIQIPIETKKNK